MVDTKIQDIISDLIKRPDWMKTLAKLVCGHDEARHAEHYLIVNGDYGVHPEEILTLFKTKLAELRPYSTLFIAFPILSISDTEIKEGLKTNWYASVPAIKFIAEDKFGHHLIGREVSISNGKRVYIGIIVNEVTRIPYIDDLASRVLEFHAEASTELEQKARIEIHLLYARQQMQLGTHSISMVMKNEPIGPIINHLEHLLKTTQDENEINNSVIRSQELEIAALKAQLQSLRSSYIALANDSSRNTTELAGEISRLKNRIRMLPEDRSGELNKKTAILSRTSNSITERAIYERRSDLPPPLKILDSTGHETPFFDVVLGTWPKHRPLVSVIITCFNYAHYIDEAIESVLRQTFESIEIIVVEGGSSDQASRIHAASLDRTQVRVLMQGHAHRAGANRNLGISQALGKYICCLDADDKLAPTYIEKAAYILESSQVDVVSAAQQCFGMDNSTYWVLARPSLEDLLSNNNVLTCAVFRRDLWERSGGFRDTDTDITGHVHEDWSYWVRLAALGARFYNMSRDPMLLYRVHSISLSRSTDVLSMSQQRKLIREINGDLINDVSISVSHKLSAETLHPHSDAPAAMNSVATRQYKYTILLAVPYLALGGAERLLSSILQYISQKDVRFIVVTSIPLEPHMGNTQAWFEKATSEIYNLPLFLPNELWEHFLYYIIESKSVDLIWVAGSAFLYDNLKHVKSRYPNLPVVDLIFNTIGHTANNRLRRSKIDHIIVENNQVLTWFIDDGVARDNLSLMESGIDLLAVRPEMRSDDIRASFTTAPEEILVAFFGRWSPEKNPLLFIEIARRSYGKMAVKFIMSGTGPMKEAVEAEIAASNFPTGYFNLLGEVDETIPYIATADLVMITSTFDGRPIVALEALACGTPVIASRVGGLPDLIEDRVTGWLCNPEEVESFCQALAEACAHREKLAKMSRNARSYAQNNLDVEVMCQKYESLFVKLIDDSKTNNSGLRGREKRV